MGSGGCVNAEDEQQCDMARLCYCKRSICGPLSLHRNTGHGSSQFLSSLGTSKTARLVDFPHLCANEQSQHSCQSKPCENGHAQSQTIHKLAAQDVIVLFHILINLAFDEAHGLATDAWRVPCLSQQPMSGVEKALV